MRSIAAPRARPQRNKNTGIQGILAAERLNEWGEVEKKHREPKRRPKRNAKRVKVMDSLDLDPDAADDDDEYQTEVVNSASESTEVSKTSDGDISNEEVSAVSPIISTFLLFSTWFQLANVLSSKMIPVRMRRAHASKRKRPEKRAGDDLQLSEATTPSITPSSSFVMEGRSKGTKQVSLLIVCISTTDKIRLRLRTRSITSIRLSPVHHMASMLSTVIGFTNAITAGGRL
jgi:hypothetical protein